MADGEWEMGGLLEWNNTDNQLPILSGDNVRMSGVVQVDGNGVSRITASSLFVNSSAVTVNSNAELQVLGETANFSGGSWQGSGVVRFGTGSVLLGYGRNFGSIADLSGQKSG